MWKAKKHERHKSRSIRSGRLVRAFLGWGLASPLGAEVAIVRDAQPVPVVVTPDEPNAVVRYAAQELVDHLERATGVRLAVVREGALPANPRARIFLGDTRAARGAGIVPASLAAETFTLRVGGKANATST